MARGQFTFRKNDLTRAIQAAKAAGLDIAKVELDCSGKITIVAAEASAGGDVDELDRELEEWETRRGQG
jgi:hypothetical protein